MKNASLVISGLLTVAVIILFVLVGKLNSGNRVSGASTSTVPVSPSDGLRIGYVRTDSLMKGYNFYQELEKKFIKKSEDFESRIAGDQRAFERDLKELQERAQFLTITERESREERLARKQQDLYRMQESLSNELMREEQKLTQMVYDTLENFLKGYAVEQKFHFILSKAKAGGIWYADPAYDITADVVERLNLRYEKQKAGK